MIGGYYLSKVKRVCAALFYFLFAAVFLLDIILEMSPRLIVPAQTKLLFAGILFLLLLAATLFCTANARNEQEKRAAVERLMWLLFALYVFNLTQVLFFDAGYGRQASYLHDLDGYDFYAPGINLQPLRTIMTYLDCWRRGVIVHVVFINLVGNLAAFAPFGYFLPAFFRAMRRWYVFLPSMAVLISLVELSQFFFRVGSCDVDDLILNLSGAALAFLLVRIPPVWRLLSRLRLTREGRTSTT